jgi:hypothetical protein
VLSAAVFPVERMVAVGQALMTQRAFVDLHSKIQGVQRGSLHFGATFAFALHVSSQKYLARH